MYVTSVKRKYRERLINREKQWPPCQSNKLVRLELVEGVKGECYYARHTRGEEDKHVKRTPLKYEDLYKVDSRKKPVRKILVEGDAGIGKTTLSIAVCEDWANERLFQQFRLLLLLPLRHKEVASVGSLTELLKLLHSSQSLCTSVADYLCETEGDEVLIIADGWDEISKNDQLKGSFLYGLLFKGHLPFASVIVTSRHSASTEFHKQPYFDRFVEITGFDKENIAEYIQSKFSNQPSKADHLEQQLEDNPLVESVCSVPLNCAIICYLWQHNDKEVLPTTMTELYSLIIRNVIFRNIEKDPNNSANLLRLSNFDDLPDDLKQAWHFLCKFAFETMTKDQVTFSEDELDKGLESHKNVFCFGLLQQSLFLLDDGYGKSYHFLHRTFQEFLAAFHLAKLASESNVSVGEIFQSLAKLGDFYIFWKFFFGIYFNVIKCDNYHAIKSYLSYVSALHKKDNDRRRFNLHLCHSAFEAKSELVYDDIIQILVNENAFKGLITFSSSHSAHDCSAMIDVIGRMKDCKIGIYFENCGIRQDQVDLLGEVLRNHETLRVQQMKLNGNKLTSVESLFSVIQNAFQSLEYLNLSDNMVKTVNFLKPPFNNLIYVNLSNNQLGLSGMNMLQTAITGGSLTNLEFLYLKNSITRDTCNADGIDPTNFSKFLGALSAHCPHLTVLDLSQNNLGVTGALELAKIKSRHKNHNSYYQDWLSEVMLNETKLGDEGLRAFTKTLDWKCCFNMHRLDGNDIHATGVRYLAEGIGSGKIVIQQGELKLEDNPLGIRGVIEVGKLLSSNHIHLKNLNLSRCQLTDPSTCDQDVCEEKFGLQLYQLPKNYTLGNLCLDGNRFTGDGIHILAGFMNLCPCLTQLSTEDCTISSSDFKLLLDKLVQLKSSSRTIFNKICSNLRGWSLYGNRIDHVGVNALIKHRPSSLFPRLVAAHRGSTTHVIFLNIGDNPVSSKMIEKLNKEWDGRQEVRCTLYYVKIPFLVSSLCYVSKI